ncbi:MAG: hypothetical protein K2N44_12965 [Lachnospiraceae bacterium]|nr:hypothetical protein [Lachnospiraceae bacterium]
MKGNLISDVQTAVGMFRDMRKARKAGQAIEFESTKSIPLMQSGAGFYDTVEGCTLSWCSREIIDASQKAFNSLPPEEKHLLAFAPKDGEFIERALFWKELLSPVMTPKNCHKAMIKIIEWYIHIKKMHSTPADQEGTSKIQNDIEQKTPVHTLQNDLKLELPVHTFRAVT